MNLFVFSALNESLRAYFREELPPEVKPVFKNELSPEEARVAFANADMLLGNPPVGWFEETPADLVFWQLDSAGFDQYREVRVAAKVANMGDFYARPCAETIVGGVLAFYRGLHVLAVKQKAKHWLGKELRPGLDLLGNKKVIVLGAGAIGQAVKQMLAGFGCDIKLTARTNPIAEIHSYEELLAALPATDVVINTLPGGAEKYVSEAFIKAMKNQSVYASVGRGSTTDEPALIAALQSGKLAGAVLDVTQTEPLPTTSPLWEMENVLLTQHTGGGQAAEDEGKIRHFLMNLHYFLNGKPIPDQVELKMGY